jgi:hypothetical protein
VLVIETGMLSGGAKFSPRICQRWVINSKAVWICGKESIRPNAESARSLRNLPLFIFTVFLPYLRPSNTVSFAICLEEFITLVGRQLSFRGQQVLCSLELLTARPVPLFRFSLAYQAYHYLFLHHPLLATYVVKSNASWLYWAVGYFSCGSSCVNAK